MNASNPYKPPAPVSEKQGYGDQATLLSAGFLYRRIEFHQPFQALFSYNGWNFLQRIHINDQLVWKRISWAVIHRQAEFRLPKSVDPAERICRMEIFFRRGLLIRKFRISLEGHVIYDE